MTDEIELMMKRLILLIMTSLLAFTLGSANAGEVVLARATC